MPKENINSIEELAVLTQNEFLDTKKRFERVDERFDRVDGVLQTVVDTLDLVRQDIHDIKVIMGPLVRTVTAWKKRLEFLISV